MSSNSTTLVFDTYICSHHYVYRYRSNTTIYSFKVVSSRFFIRDPSSCCCVRLNSQQGIAMRQRHTSSASSSGSPVLRWRPRSANSGFFNNLPFASSYKPPTLSDKFCARFSKPIVVETGHSRDQSYSWGLIRCVQRATALDSPGICRDRKKEHLKTWVV